MKVILSARVEADIASQLEYGINHFGRHIGERTFARIDAFLSQFLPNHPYAGKYIEGAWDLRDVDRQDTIRNLLSRQS